MVFSVLRKSHRGGIPLSGRYRTDDQNPRINCDDKMFIQKDYAINKFNLEDAVILLEQPGVLSRAAMMTWKRPAVQRQSKCQNPKGIVL